MEIEMPLLKEIQSVSGDFQSNGQKTEAVQQDVLLLSHAFLSVLCFGAIFQHGN